MRTLFLPEGNALTDQQFTQSALESPLSGWRTFGYAARTAVEQGLLGTAVREAQAPDLSGTYEMRPAGKAVVQRFVPDTPEQAAAKGETLYPTAEEYKASPWYRENVPFEPGMTASRAQALAEMSDLTAIRDYYTSKRPVTSFFGSVVGAGLAPENYIPILGEGAATVTTARMGKVAGRMLLSGSDAALNAAAFQLLTMPERTRLGDDTSWQAFMENTAFAALAGTAFGGAFGGIEKIRERYKAPPPDLGGNQPIRQSGEALSADLGARGNQPPDLTMGGDIPATMAPDYLRPTDVLDRIETPAARARANAVMNDAVTGLAIDGEVRLGEQTRAHIEGVQADAARYDATLIRESNRKVSIGFHGSPYAQSFDIPRASSGGELGAGVYFSRDEKLASGYSRNGDLTGREGVLELKASGLNIKDVTRKEYLARRAAIYDAEEKRAGGWSREVADTGDKQLIQSYQNEGFDGIYDTSTQQGVVFPESTARLSAYLRRPPPEVTVSNSYAVPAPEPRPAQIDASYGLVDSLPKASTPEVKRMVEQAKAEGFDPEAGTTDLDTDIDIMKQLETLTPEETAALAAADETFKAAEAWGDVAEQLIACKASNA